MVTLSSRNVRAKRQHKYKYIPQLFLCLIFVCIAGCVWFLDVQTSRLEEGLLSVPSNQDKQQQENNNNIMDNVERVQEEINVNIIKKKAQEKAAAPQENENAVEDKSVACGGHRAASCSQCPLGNGAMWCHGDCAWCDSKQECQDKNADCLAAKQKRVVCGGHTAASCEECPQGHGEE
jgi:hypothetical protein